MIFPTTFEGAAPFRHFGFKRAKTGMCKKISANGCKYHNLCLLVSGMRCKSTEELVKKTADEFKPERVIICGFAGACDPKLENGDFIYDTNDADMNKILSPICRRGVIKCSDHIVERSEKLELFKRGILAVETESEVFMGAIKELSPNATFTHIRCISDSVDSKIPASFFSEVLDHRDGTLSLRKISLQLLKRPSLLIALRKFAEEVKPAHKKYEETIVKILSEMR